MKTLRILHINTERTWRGGEQLTLYTIQGLAKRGHFNHLLAQPNSPMATRAKEAGHDVIEYPMYGEIDLRAVYFIARLAHRWKYHIFHLHTPHAHMLGGLASLGGRRPIRVVNKRTDFSIYRNSFFGLNRYKYVLLADCVIAESKKIQEVLLQDGIDKKKIALIYEGIDPERFQRGNPQRLRREFSIENGAKVVGNIAHFADHKGQIYFVEAIPKILKRFPDSFFFLVGQGELRQKLMHYAQELGISQRVFFPGFRKDVEDFLHLFDVFVISSHMEGLCTSIMDAYAAGTPVVATTAGGIPELVENEKTGILVPPRDPEALADAVCTMLASPAKAKRFVAKGKEVLYQKFSAEAMVEQTLDLYRRLLKSKRRR